MSKSLAAQLSPPARLLVITEGVKGSHVWTGGGVYLHQPAFPASPVVDTTGVCRGLVRLHDIYQPGSRQD